jgi:predicted phosphodiesterase
VVGGVSSALGCDRPSKTPVTGEKSTLTESELPLNQGLSRFLGADRIHRKIVNLIHAANPVVVFHTGDMVDDGDSRSQWATFKDITGKILGKLYPSVGNHDTGLVEQQIKFPNNRTYYRVETNFGYFFVLDTTKDYDTRSEQYKWLEESLKEVYKKSKYRFVVFHNPPFSSGDHGEDSDAKKYLVPLFEKYGVNIVFNGHDHNYEHMKVNEIHYVVAGGGGARLRDQKYKKDYSIKFLKDTHYLDMELSAEKIDIKVWNENKKALDKWSIQTKTPKLLERPEN